MNDWRNNIGNMDVLPDTPVANTTLLWEKLHSRLDKKKKRIPFYWLAAAAVLIAIVTTPFVQFNSNRNDISIEEKKKSETISVSTEVAKTKAAVVINEPAIIKKAFHSKLRNKKNATIDSAIEAPVVIEIPDKIEPADTPIVVTQPIAQIPVKKLKVIHINEIISGENTDEIVSNKTIPVIRVNDRTNDSYKKSYVVNNSSDNIIKIKLPSN